MNLRTAILLVVALVAVGLVHLDPAAGGAGGGFVSTTSAARRVFPGLQDAALDQARIDLAPSEGPATAIVPAPGGHVLEVGGTLVGPADPDAVEGLWASLRMARTLRAVDDADAPALGQGGITVTLGDVEHAVRIGASTPDGVGLYGTLQDAGGDQVWVVERELGQILAQAPDAWLARRLIVVDAAVVTSVAFGELDLTRGADGLWRAATQAGPSILSADTVDARLSRLVSARLDPMLDPEASSGISQPRPWLALMAQERRIELRLAGPCPGHPGKVVVVRDVGWPGCLDQSMTQPWDTRRMLEAQLSPYDYGRVLRVEQVRPEPRVVRRQGGDWVVEEGGVVTEVAAAEVFRWYEALQRAEVEPVDARLDESAGVVELVVHADAAQHVRLVCDLEATLCQRDGGPVLRVRDRDVAIAFSADTFTPRTLFDFKPEDARGLEILPGDAGATVRQSAHFDMGVWRFDAPSHPDGDDAMSELLLEDLLAAVASVRAEAWLASAPGRSERVIRIERTPQRGRDSVLELVLHADCVAVARGRVARVRESSCDALRTDILHDDPLRFWIDTARSLELELGGEVHRLKRVGERLTQSGDAPGPAVRGLLDELSALRSLGLRAGRPPGASRTSLRILPKAGPAFVVEVGKGWARIVAGEADKPWYYVLERPQTQ